MNWNKKLFLFALCLLTASCGGSGENASSSGSARNMVLLVHGYQGNPDNMNFYNDNLHSNLKIDRCGIAGALCPIEI
jgi:hypothetical protein